MNTILRSRLNNMLGNHTLICTSTMGTITMKAALDNGGMDFVVDVTIKGDDGKVENKGHMSTRQALEAFGDVITHSIVKKY